MCGPGLQRKLAGIAFKCKFTPENVATPLIKTLSLVPRVAGLEGFHCNIICSLIFVFCISTPNYFNASSSTLYLCTEHILVYKVQS